MSSTADAVLPEAVDAARAALVAEVGSNVVGEARAQVVEGDGVTTQYFACTKRGYPGWQWAVTLAHPAGAEAPTIDEVVLLPGDGAIVAPAWVPYRDRIRPGDLSPGDILPTDEDDIRLVSTFLAGDEDDPIGDDERGQHQAVAKELGLGRTRVLSVEGRAQAADRWYVGDQGPDSPLAQQAHHQCWSCGFVVRLAGALADDFGVCANEFANDDGRVVAFGHGCGAHSEAQLRRKQLPAPVPEPFVDTLTPGDLERF